LTVCFLLCLPHFLVLWAYRFLCLGISGGGTSNTSRAEKPGVNKSESTPSRLKLERSKTEGQRHQNILAEEAAKIYDDKLPDQEKVLLAFC